jgi:putative GTP pyrophosphokinase
MVNTSSKKAKKAKPATKLSENVPFKAGETSKDKLLPQKAFLEKYDIEKSQFTATKIKWKDLEAIFEDYLKIKEALDHTGQSVVKILFTPEAKDSGVHSVRYRVKDAHGLIEKIIRRKIETPSKKNLSVSDYREEITDLIGVRALHVFKQDWYGVGNFIKGKWDFKNGHKKPIVYHRAGDSSAYLDECKGNGCSVKEHPKGYRSIHYIIQVSATKEVHYVEIQVRTIYEEGWSEIDHKIRYSSKKKDKEHPLEGHLLILNSLSGSADDLGKLLKRSKTDIDNIQYDTKNKKRKGGQNA